MKRITQSLLVLLALLVPSLAPAVGLVQQSGPRLFTGTVSLTDGGSFTLSGTGFGSNVSAASQSYECDALEGQSNGTSLTAAILGSSEWVKQTADVQLISTARTYNCGRSILNRWDNPSGNTSFGFQRDYSSTYKAIYTESYVYLDVGSQEAGQLKLERFGDAVGPGLGLGDGTGGSDEQPNLFYQYYPATEGGSGQYPCNLVVNNSEAQSSGNTNFNFGGPTTDKMIQRSQWTLVQKFLVPGTAGTADGSAQVRSTRTDTNAVICANTRTGRIFRATGEAEYQRWTLQYYIGNGFQVAAAEVYLDGWFYSIVNTVDSTFPKIVWFCNKSTWASVTASSDTVCVVQPFATWSSTTITGTFNQGRLSGLTPGTHFWGYVLQGINDPINTNGIVPTTMVDDAANDPYAFADLELAA